jgi:hypothetical protein
MQEALEVDEEQLTQAQQEVVEMELLDFSFFQYHNLSAHTLLV